MTCMAWVLGARASHGPRPPRWLARGASAELSKGRVLSRDFLDDSPPPSVVGIFQEFTSIGDLGKPIPDPPDAWRSRRSAPYPTSTGPETGVRHDGNRPPPLRPCSLFDSPCWAPSSWHCDWQAQPPDSLNDRQWTRQETLAATRFLTHFAARRQAACCQRWQTPGGDSATRSPSTRCMTPK